MLNLQDPRTHPLLAVLGAALALIACGAGDDAAPSAASGESGSTRAPGEMSAAPAAAASNMAENNPAASSSANPSASPTDTSATSSAVRLAADQLPAACGSVFDTCMATPGCNDILSCAASSGCTGMDCYCADASCQSAGPCRTVIAAAPGARVPEPSNLSPGPAGDAAGKVGACLLGLANAGAQ